MSCVKILLISVSAVILNDGVYHIIVDQVPFLKGDLLKDLEPAINPLAEIDDPNDNQEYDVSVVWEVTLLLYLC